MTITKSKRYNPVEQSEVVVLDDDDEALPALNQEDVKPIEDLAVVAVGSDIEGEDWNDEATCAGVVGGAAGLVVGGVWLSLVCATGCMFVAKEERGRMGDAARACGTYACKVQTAVQTKVMSRGRGDEPNSSTSTKTGTTEARPGQETVQKDAAGTVWMTISDPITTAKPSSSATLEETTTSEVLVLHVVETPKKGAVDFVQQLRWCVPCTPTSEESSCYLVPGPSSQNAFHPSKCGVSLVAEVRLTLPL
jgi:hypothetical protein